ncbi:VpaChn25_0724 family phage protein [Candidatus Vondammii sp. HM_W22]|uniref:VpaChn25_0724 family phage protein n=1 Tax=Candidatus Vondammii sp. HM_W22 TaxID=2687299 RepID=UPI001F14046A|nr:hypothetical protein [Candidatus Vondammii sp. HM_W22]
MSYEEIVASDQRLVLLQVLEENVDYAHNETVLQRALEAMGHSISSDRLRTELAWLSEQGLITVENLAGLQVAKLTNRGEDVALGHARVPGIARPRPGG